MICFCLTPSPINRSIADDKNYDLQHLYNNLCTLCTTYSVLLCSLYSVLLYDVMRDELSAK